VCGSAAVCVPICGSVWQYVRQFVVVHTAVCVCLCLLNIFVFELIRLNLSRIRFECSQFFFSIKLPCLFFKYVVLFLITHCSKLN
jgi:hypothetical protein